MTPPGPTPTIPAFRHEAPNVAPEVIGRGRLLDLVRGRFERRLTVITAGAGFGKTTLLSQAVLANEVEQLGLDVWLRLESADRDPDHLLSGIGRSLAGPGANRTVTTVDHLVDLVWARAPLPVAFVLDDCHVLDGADAAWATVRALVEQLPTNGSVVLAGRTSPSVPIRRLQVADAAVVIDETSMAFNEAELAEFGEARSLPPELVADLAPWPALAVLATAVGHGAPTDFLWREVLSSMADDRRELFARASMFDVVDETVVESLAPGAGWSAKQLLAGLPLVDVDRLGSFRLHALWGDVLEEYLDPRARRDALTTGADALLRDRQHLRAAAAYAKAGDTDGLHRAIRTFATQPIAVVSIPDVVELFELLPDDLREAPIGLYLHAARHWSGDQRDAAARFEHAMRRAEADGDREIESLARWRLVQLRYLDDHSLLGIEPRMEELAAEGVPLASSSVAFVRSVQAQNEGRIDEALVAIELLDGFDPGQRQTSMMSRLIDLGRPESVSVTLDSVLGSEVIDLFGAQAIWLRGEIDPETGWAIASQLPGVAGRTGVVNEQVTIRCIVATVALAAGADADARRLVDEALGSYDLGGAQVRLVAQVADALVALHTDGEAAARERLEQALASVPLGRWPARAYLHGLATLRALVPGTESLDTCPLGPSLSLAVRAGRAVLAGRAGDPDAGDDLPWETPALLRCQIPPPLLAELALAGATRSGPEATAARAVLEQIPGLHRWLARLVASDHPVLATHARAVLDAMPVRPMYDLRIEALGQLRIVRSDGVEVEPCWETRDRVRQILTRLLVGRVVNRTELAASLWPDLPADKASANLRVNLRHLQRALQPDREPDSPPWFLRSEATELRLVDEGVTVDVDQFDELVSAAVRAEAAGMPSVALVEYQSAAELYRGDLLEGVDDPDVETERLRLRSMAHGAACRRGELVLARDEPEAAMRLANAALQLDPLSERAHRLSIRCQLAMGSTSAARSAVQRLIGLLADVGVSPDDETRLLIARLDHA